MHRTEALRAATTLRWGDIRTRRSARGESGGHEGQKRGSVEVQSGQAGEGR